MEEREIDLLQIWETFKSKLVYIVLISLIFAAAFLGVSKFLITPKYKAETSIIISKTQNDENSVVKEMQISDLRLNQELVNTYSEIIKTRGIADMVIKNLGLDMTPEKFKSMVSVTPKNNTEIFNVSIVDTIPERAMDIANETSEVFKASIKEIMKIDNVQILDSAVLPEDPASPNNMRNTILGAMLGFVLSAFIFILKELLDNTVKSSEDFANEFELPVLGIIPDNKKLEGRKK